MWNRQQEYAGKQSEDLSTRVGMDEASLIYRADTSSNSREIAYAVPAWPTQEVEDRCAWRCSENQEIKRGSILQGSTLTDREVTIRHPLTVQHQCNTSGSYTPAKADLA